MRYLTALTKCANLRDPNEYILMANHFGDNPGSMEDALLRSEVLTMGLHRFPTSVDLLIARGSNYHMLSRPDQALADLNRAERLDPFCASRFYIVRAEIYEAKNELEKAHQEYVKAARVDGKSPQGFGGAARVLLKMGKPARALHYANRAVYITEKLPYWLWLRSQCHAKAGYLEDAVADARVALEGLAESGQNTQHYQDHLNRLISSVQLLA